MTSSKRFTVLGALGMAAASEQLPATRFPDYAIVGELALDGSVRPVAGALCMAMAARDQGLRGIILPRANAEEAGVVPEMQVIPVSTLTEAAEFVTERTEIAPFRTDLHGAFSRAQAEGMKVFDTLVSQGQSLEAKTRRAQSPQLPPAIDRLVFAAVPHPVPLARLAAATGSATQNLITQSMRKYFFRPRSLLR